MIYGVWSIDGITRHDPGGSAAGRQALYAGVGMVLLVVASLIDPALYRRWSRAIYFGLTGVMGFVLVFGAATRGSRRWIDIGFFTFQPSEFGKVLLALFLGGLPRGPLEAARRARRAAEDDRPRGRARSCSSSSSRTSAPRSSTSPSSPPCSSSPASAGRISR